MKSTILKAPLFGILALATPLALPTPALAMGITTVSIPIPSTLTPTNTTITVTPGPDIPSVGGFFEAGAPGSVLEVPPGPNSFPGFNNPYLIISPDAAAASFPSPDISGNATFLSSATVSFDFLGVLDINVVSGTEFILAADAITSNPLPEPFEAISPTSETVDILAAIQTALAGTSSDGMLIIEFFNENSGLTSDAGISNVVLNLHFEFPDESVPEPGTLVGTMFVVGLGVCTRRKRPS